MRAADRRADSPRYLALCGGIGGAKLALGLSRVLPPQALTIAVNTGDDFTHAGLSICPDLDTVTYTLAGLAQPDQGWGREGDSWRALEEVQRLGGPSWFRLGDLDLGLHLTRRAFLDEGLSLSEITTRIATRLGVEHTITPMTDGTVRTQIESSAGTLSFQHYFVRDQCAPQINAIGFIGAEHSLPAPALMAALADPELAGIIICPSNPFLSIDPILALPGVRECLRQSPAPVIAVAPIVGGAALKGPTTKIMRELGHAPTAAAVAHYYRDFLDGYVLDSRDQDSALSVSRMLSLLPCNIVMRSLEDKIALARTCLDFLTRLALPR